MSQLNSLPKLNNNHLCHINSITFKNKIAQQISFRATLYQKMRDNALTGTIGGVTTGTGFDLALGGSTLGINTAIGGLLGLIGGSIQGILNYLFEKEVEAELEKYNNAHKDFPRIEKNLDKVKQEILNKLKNDPQATQKLSDELIRLLHSPNAIIDMQSLEKLGIIGLGTIAGYQEDKISLEKSFITPFVNSITNNNSNDDVPNGVLLYGISGNGKTKMASALYEQALGDRVTSNLYKVSVDDSDSIVDKLTEIKKKAKKIFKTTGQRSIIFIDEIDKIIPKSAWKIHDGSTSMKVKKLLDNCSKDGITVIATTSNPQNLDSIIIKDSNIFSVKTLIEQPSTQDIEELLKAYMPLIEVNSNLNFTELAEYIETKAKENNSLYSCKQIELIAKEVENIGIENCNLSVTQEDVMEVIEKFQPDISAKSLTKFKKDFAYIAGCPYEQYLEQKKSGNKT